MCASRARAFTVCVRSRMCARDNGLTGTSGTGETVTLSGRLGETAQRDAKSLASWSDLVCAEANSEFRNDELKKQQWGKQCHEAVQRLAKIETDLQAGSLEALLRDLERRDGKAAADAALAAALAKRAADAAERMEQADAAVESDRVDGSWACAVNGVGGLRAQGCLAQAPGTGRGDPRGEG